MFGEPNVAVVREKALTTSDGTVRSALMSMVLSDAVGEAVVVRLRAARATL
jgi:hypothetical protein